MIPLPLRSFSLRVLATSLLCATTAMCQQFAPSIRIHDKIDDSDLVTLKGNTHPAAIAKNDLGKVSDGLPMTDLILVLSRDPAQQAAFNKFLASQYDSTSANFHQWLTPEQVGEDFGPSDTDIATISNWLVGHGFTIGEVTKDHMSIRFSGTAGQVQSTFHTEIHNLSVKGVTHIANMSDPRIPAALAPVVIGVKALHNFFPRPEHHLGSMVSRDASTGKWKRLTASGNNSRVDASTATASRVGSGFGLASTLSTGPRTLSAKPQFGINASSDGYPYLVEDVDPWDFATIYNILPLWNAGTPVDGTGQTIAIAGTSDIDVGQAASSETGANGINDVLTFRTYFGLPTANAVNTPKRISGNSQPLTVCTDTTGSVPFEANPCGIGDLTENSLDVEWSGSIAKNAQIILVSSYPASVSDDNLYDSESYIVNNLTARIMNVSYGECELANGTAGNVEYYNLWSTAAAEGISVFVAAGDSGSASCDDGNAVAESGLTVSGLASTPWNTAVGGTDFNWCNPDTANGSAATECTAAPYWSSTAVKSPGSSQAVTTALGYVPETPWNESCTNPLTLKWVQDAANYEYSIASSQITNPEQACNFINDYDFTYYQGSEGLLETYPYLTYLIETVGGSGGASGCVTGSAVVNPSTGEMTGCSAGATSTGTTSNPDTGASQASLTLVNNGWPKPSWQTGVGGIPSDGVRDLPDVSFFAADGYVSSSAYLICVSAAQSNTPCTYSTYSESFYQEVGGTSVATPAMAGIMALVNQKTGVAQGLANPELYKLAAKQTYSSCSAETATTGNGCYFNDIDQYTSAMPCDAYDTTPNCTALSSTLGYPDTEGIGILTGYSAATGYDLATGLGSLNVANVVNAWVSDVGSASTTISITPTPNPVSLGVALSVQVTVASNPAGGATPTGSVTLSGGGYTSATETLTGGTYTFTVPAGSLTGGTDTLTVTYSGDANYAPSSQTTSETVNKLSATVSASPAPAAIESNQQVVITGTVSGPQGDATPTGTVTVSYGATYTSQAVKLNSSGQYSVTITPNSLAGGTPNQNDTLNVQYSGDGNYSPASTTTSVTVTFFQVLTPTVSITTAATNNDVDSGTSLLVTVSVSAPIATPANPVPTGTVTLSGSGYSLTSATLSNGTAQFTIPANTLNSVPNAPSTDPITAAYQGDANYAQVSTSINLTVTQSAYTLTTTGPTAPVAPGSSATASISVGSSTDYSGAVTFTSAECVLTGYPAGVLPSAPGNPVCNLTGSGAVTVTNGAPSNAVTYTVSTTGATTAAVDLPALNLDGTGAQLAQANSHAPRTGGGTSWLGAAGGVALAALFLFWIPGGTRKWRKMLSVLLLMVAASFTIVGCGGGGSSTPTSPTLATPIVSVVPSQTSIAVNAPLTVAVSVTGTAGTATGGVGLSGGGYISPAGSGALASGSTSFSIPASSFTTIGTVTLTATYGGSTSYNSTSGTATISVSNVPTTAGTYTFTVTPTSSPASAAPPSTTFTVTVN